ncbi:hypothetical protein [Pontibacter pamirensis]|uniref:hypothetical protein n=1 Tax=Pontibacter pamirensis TaxID=2562824 RepID=UPI00138A2745|nr:hypothetical protein [Pontibacter pamirensis]
MKTKKASFDLSLLPLIALTSALIGNKPPDTYFEVNLIKNPGAEEKVTGQEIPAWSVTPEMPEWRFMHGTYGEFEGEWKKGCNERCGLAPKPGKSYFRIPLDSDTPRVALYQEIDLSPISKTIEERRILAELQGYFAGTPCGNKKCVTARVVKSYYDREGKLVGGVYSANADSTLFEATERGGSNMYRFKSYGLKGVLPKEAVTVIIKLEGQKANCCDRATVFFDNVSYVLTEGGPR